MVRALHAALLAAAVVSLLVVAGVAGATPASSAQTADEENVTLSSPIAAPPNDSTSGTGSVSTDAGMGLESDFRTLESRYHQLVLDERLEESDDDSERRGLLRDEVSRLDERITSLRAAERETFRAYAANEIDEETALLRLARIHATAGALDGSVGHVSDRADDVPGTAQDQEFAQLSTETETLQGPVRGRVAADLRGEDRAETVRVTATEAGGSLAGIYGGTYEREASRARDPADGAALGPGEAWEAVQDQYPWIAALPATRTSWGLEEPGTGFGSPAYRVDVAHPHGSLVTYVNSVSGTVFFEHQRNPLDEVPTTGGADVTDGNLRLVVDRTYPTGPTRVALSDPDTGDPVTGEVTVDGAHAGETRGDGVLWVVSPPGEINVSATAGSDTITASVGSGAQR